jgi:hypothetical protein
MSTVFVDRESAYPNRYLLIPDSGEPYHVILERADEPVTPGTPLNAETFNRIRDEIDAAREAIAVESTDYPGCFYRTVNGVKEWLNPPMVPDVEYRTVKRANGKVIYAKRITLGACPAGSSAEFKDKWTAVGIQHSCVESFEAFCVKTVSGNELKRTLPAFTGDKGEMTLNCYWQYTSFVLRAFADMSHYIAYVNAEYTK